MKLEHQVANLELSKRIKELGVVQESAFYWFSMNHEKFNVVGKNFTKITDWSHNQILNVTFPDTIPIIYSAFTVAELGVMLLAFRKENFCMRAMFVPQSLDEGKCGPSGLFRTYYEHDYDPDNYYLESSETESDARAKMLIYLIKNKLVTVEEINQRLGLAE